MLNIYETIFVNKCCFFSKKKVSIPDQEIPFLPPSIIHQVLVMHVFVWGTPPPSPFGISITDYLISSTDLESASTFTLE